MNLVSDYMTRLLGKNWATIVTNWAAALSVFGAFLSSTFQTHAITVTCAALALVCRILHGIVAADDQPTTPGATP